jgi:hypothetical protein
MNDRALTPRDRAILALLVDRPQGMKPPRIGRATARRLLQLPALRHVAIAILKAGRDRRE